MPIEEYLQAVVKPLLRHPEDLKVTNSQDEMGILLTLDVNSNDMGSIIGKKGDTANAVRHLVRIVGLIAKQRVSIRISEPEGSNFKPKY